MAVYNRIANFHDEMVEWRHDIHSHPETAFEEVRTADVVAEKLESFGIEIHRGLATTGVVGTLKNGTSNKKIGLRADMDALDLMELNEFDYRSKIDGKMHACGHDGHTTMLLGAAKYLSETRNFDGTIFFIFQPAEENEAGGRVMVEDGLFKLFPADSVYGLHNIPGIPVGQAAVEAGPMMASADFFYITVTGVGAHGAYPHNGVDPILVASEIVMALQRIVSRSTDPMKQSVVSVTQFNSGFTTNVIPETATISGTTRAFLPEIQDMIEKEMGRIVSGICAAHGATYDYKYDRRYPPTINSEAETVIARKAAVQILGEEGIMKNPTPTMGAEDFAWMLLEKPGCYIWLGNGSGAEGGCAVHNPNYDFNDEILSMGASYFARLVENELSTG